MRQIKKTISIHIAGARTLAVALLLVMWSTGAQAQLGWFTCEVVYGGKVNPDVVFIQLTDTKAVPTFTGKWFRAKSGIENEMLAAALAALTAGMLVSVQTDPDELGAPEIRQLYLKQLKPVLPPVLPAPDLPPS